ELRQHQHVRDGWLEANAHLGPQYRQVVRALAWQRRATGVAVEADRPGYALEALGPVPDSTRGRRAWRQGAAEIEHYRHTYQITDPDRALGPEPADRAQRADRHQAAPPSASRPASTPANRDLRSSVAGPARSGPPASTTRKGAPRWPALDRGPSTTTRTGPAGRGGRSPRPTCRPSSPTSTARTPTRSWPAPCGSAGCGGAGAGQ